MQVFYFFVDNLHPLINLFFAKEFFSGKITPILVFEVLKINLYLCVCFSIFYIHKKMLNP